MCGDLGHASPWIMYSVAEPQLFFTLPVPTLVKSRFRVRNPDCVWAEIYRIVCQKSALSPGDMEETIRPSGLEAINVKEGRAPPHQYAVGGADPRILIFSSRIQA